MKIVARDRSGRGDSTAWGRAQRGIFGIRKVTRSSRGCRGSFDAFVRSGRPPLGGRSRLLEESLVMRSTPASVRIAVSILGLAIQLQAAAPSTNAATLSAGALDPSFGSGG